SQSYWRNHVQEPKTRKSKAPVPVISQLADRLELHRELSGSPEVGLMFPSPLGTPINVDALAMDGIRPALEKAGLAWHGWHAFRRGLATNLHHLGVPDETIQRILRHSTVAVTQNCHIKTAHADAVAAMRSLENAPWESAAHRIFRHFVADDSVNALFSVVWKSGGEGGIRTPDTASDRITV
ncbi:MAG: hypothetical protein WAM71_20195, partial [Candidatus Korobacteraceae bacterium]